MTPSSSNSTRTKSLLKKRDSSLSKIKSAVITQQLRDNSVRQEQIEKHAKQVNQMFTQMLDNVNMLNEAT